MPSRRHDMEPMGIATLDGPYNNAAHTQNHSNRSLWMVALTFTFAGAFSGSALANMRRSGRASSATFAEHPSSDMETASSASSSMSSLSDASRHEAKSWGPDPHPSAPFPRIAWLMSFPNSGTSYTSALIRSSTLNFVATNYGDANVLQAAVEEEEDDDDDGGEGGGNDGNDDDNGNDVYERSGRGEDAVASVAASETTISGSLGTSIPVFESSPTGPFWADPSSKRLRKPTGGYILTKTHCGGYCMNCGPSKYIITEHIFLVNCLTGKHTFINKKDGKLKTEMSSYRPDLVQRAVHLIRDPFDNVVSRYHLELNKLTHKMKRAGNDTKSKYATILGRYTRDMDGFRSFCSDENRHYAPEEISSKFIDDDLYNLIKDVPCHADFVRYVQWHNLAFVVTSNLRLPTLVMHYENYETNFNQTLSDLVEFLERDVVAEPATFEGGKHYRDEYFTFEERGRVYEFMSSYAYRETWDAVERYFDDVEQEETGRKRWVE